MTPTAVRNRPGLRMNRNATPPAPDPYRFFFPLGWALGIWGALVWILGAARIPYERLAAVHPDLMIGAFLFAFVCGFLMTAIPRFTSTPRASRTEIGAQMLILLTITATGIQENVPAMRGAVLIGLSALLAFVMRRFARRTANPPPTFVFIGVGIACGLSGVALLVATDFGLLGTAVIPTARALYLHGLVLSLVLGVGGRLIPALLGFAPMPNPDAPPGAPLTAYARALPPSVWAGAAALLASFPLDAWPAAALGLRLRAAVVVFVAVRFWSIHRAPHAKTRLAYWLWISAWLTVLGYVAAALWPRRAADILHIAFIGGFGLMTLLVATRVTVAHGGHGAEAENSPVLGVTAVLVLLALLVRLSVAWAPHDAPHQVVYAAAWWILALLVWGATFVRKMLFVAP